MKLNLLVPLVNLNLININMKSFLVSCAWSMTLRHELFTLVYTCALVGFRNSNIFIKPIHHSQSLTSLTYCRTFALTLFQTLKLPRKTI